MYASADNEFIWATPYSTKPEYTVHSHGTKITQTLVPNVRTQNKLYVVENTSKKKRHKSHRLYKRVIWTCGLLNVNRGKTYIDK